MAAVSSSASLASSLSSLSLTSLQTPLTPPITVALSAASFSSNSSSSTILKIRQPLITPVIREVSPDIQSVLFPSLAFSNTLFFKTPKKFQVIVNPDESEESHFSRPYNVQLIVDPKESEESLIGRFRREVFRANIIQECKRRRFFETNQEKRKRKVRDAARRRVRRRPRPVVEKKEIPRKKVDVEPDNWGPIDVDIPYCR